VSFDLTSGHSPDNQARARLDRRFDGAHGGFLARAAGDEQNVVTSQWDIPLLSSQNVFHVHRHLLAPIDLMVQPHDLGMPCVSSPVQPLGERERLQHGDGLMFAEHESTRTLHFPDDVHHLCLGNGYFPRDSLPP
jgi:hypothetical protein